MNKSIDINCDLGESYGNFTVGNDDAVFPFLTSCNIACGFHGGDPLHIKETITKAIEHKVQIGAHPSYPDRLGFGRNKMNIPAKELQAIVEYQVATLKSLTESHGTQLVYVKPHGALYNSISKDIEEGKLVIDAIQTIDAQLKIMGLAGSEFEKLANSMGIDFIPEGFADRTYESDGNLRSRKKTNAVIISPEQAAKQVLSMVSNNRVISFDQDEVSINAKSICIHGDNPHASDILKAIHNTLSVEGIKIQKF